MVAGPIVGEAIGGPEDSCLCADDAVLVITNPGGPPLDAPCPSPWWRRRRKKKHNIQKVVFAKSAWVSGSFVQFLSTG